MKQKIVQRTYLKTVVFAGTVLAKDNSDFIA